MTLSLFKRPLTLRLLRRNLALPYSHHRALTVLAIETSCDDTSVALLDSPTPSTTTILAQETVTSPNRIYGGIHPLVSVVSHSKHLSTLISTIIPSLPNKQRPDLIAVTRGPGMPGSLAVGIDTAKGLSLAWGIPLIGVNHMQAHALTPRLISALEGGDLTPGFPFMALLVSGGHTMVVKSSGLTSHKVLADTMDMALGDVLDKCARTILPGEVLEQKGGAVAYGAVLEEFCFGGKEGDLYRYYVKGSEERKMEDKMEAEKWGDWRLSVPLAKTRTARGLMRFSFSGLGSSLERYFKLQENLKKVVSEEERKEIGRKVMILAFEHIASRVVIGLNNLSESEKLEIKDLVVSGGVAANGLLKHLLKRYLEERGYRDIRLVVPPQKYCTDNAAMIAWAGLEMYRDGWQTSLMALPLKKWSLDDEVYTEEGDSDDESGPGGVLGVSHWEKRDI